MATTADAILNTAQECFFRHGYGATNIAMISRQTKISRVTIHKHFGSKDKLLRAVMSRHMEGVREQFPRYLEDYHDLWQTIEDVLIACGRPLFESITDQWVLQELIQAGEEYCDDIKAAHFVALENFMESLFLKALEENEISLDRLGLAPKALSHTLACTTKGLFSTAPLEEIRQELTRVLLICKVAAQPS